MPKKPLLVLPLLFLWACATGAVVESTTIVPDGGVTASDGGTTGTDDSGTTGDPDAAVDNGTATAPSAGDLLISEIMYDPSGPEPDEEWIEVYNTTSGGKSLANVVIADKLGRDAKITGTVVVPAHGYLLLVNKKSAALAASVPNATKGYEYGGGDGGGPMLTNGTTGGVSLSLGGATLAQVDYGGWFSEPTGGGSSIQLATLTTASENTKTGWCLSQNAWSGGTEKGTPGAANDCP